MILDIIASAKPGHSGRRTWRITTAARVFAIALVIGRALSSEGLESVTVLVLVLVLIAALASLLEAIEADVVQRWVPLVEGLLVGAVVAADPTSEESILVYLAVPPLVAGIRYGWLSASNSFLVAASAVLVLGRVSSRPQWARPFSLPGSG